MMKNTLTVTVIALATSAVVACDRNKAGNHETSTAPHTAADQNDRDTAIPISLTGCLQKDGRTFIVTRMNEPSQKNVGTSGNGSAVEHEQLRAAANAYRVEPEGDVDMDAMVGKQVRVMGNVEEHADLPPANTSSSSNDRGTSNREEIGRGDLAKISAASVSTVAENCGSGAAATSGSKSETPGARDRK
jgi:hypothetical protein